MSHLNFIFESHTRKSHLKVTPKSHTRKSKSKVTPQSHTRKSHPKIVPKKLHPKVAPKVAPKVTNVLEYFSPYHFYLDTMLYDATNALSHTHAPKHTHPLSQRGDIWTHTDPHLTIYWSFFTIKVILQFFSRNVWLKWKNLWKNLWKMMKSYSSSQEIP